VVGFAHATRDDQLVRHHNFDKGPTVMRSAVIRRRAPRLLAIALVATLPWLAAPSAFAEVDREDDEEPSSLSAERLAEEFSDPLTTLPQVFLQDAYTPVNYGIDSSTNRVIARIIVPRLPRYSLFPFVQLVRPSFSLVTVPTGSGRTRTAFGDMQLFDLAVIPWPGKQSGLLMGVGPVFVFPTATDRAAGQGAWQVGPAFGAIYKGLPGWLFGCLIQDPISFAYTSRDRPPVGVLTFQPIVLRHIWRGLYAKSADASWAYGWRDGSSITVPLSFGLGWVIVREGLSPINVFVTGEWMAYRRDAPVAPQTTVRFGMTIGFPQWRPW
jgi:hypothetical protein